MPSKIGSKKHIFYVYFLPFSFCGPYKRFLTTLLAHYRKKGIKKFKITLLKRHVSQNLTRGRWTWRQAQAYAWFITDRPTNRQTNWHRDQGGYNSNKIKHEMCTEKGTSTLCNAINSRRHAMRFGTMMLQVWSDRLAADVREEVREGGRIYAPLSKISLKVA